ncbi:TIGR02594 family protein [Salmonella enterica subsp. enterica serovar Aba]|nr:TIGR02594 family protein [Salmonella enterica subsp. enterica serovar Aba]EBY6260727.1 TIGR02594 family protein [Salmonella enterica subsp. enterica serovar Warnow]ECG5317620.1 TIGR02594 family protein [Salmonella enterica subsp. enterica serovar Aba]
MKEPSWLVEARKNIDVREIKGPQHAPQILQYWRDIKRGGIKDDETPWCAAFVGAMLERAGIPSSRFESAKSYLEWGNALKEAAYGCVAVLSRAGGGHVGFVVGRNAAGDLMILGGNQADAVNIKAFPCPRVSDYRWPAGVTDVPQSLPLLNAEKSTSEN